MPVSLLATKIYIPRARPHAIARPRPLTLVSASAGFGKATLLSEWIPQSEHCVTWLALDEGDNDPVRFWTYIVAALQRLRADNPGLWMLHCYILAHDSQGMDMMVEYPNISTPYTIGTTSGNDPF